MAEDPAGSRASSSVWREISALVMIASVFGLAALLIILDVDPAAIAGILATTCLTAAELVRRVRRELGSSKESRKSRNGRRV